MAKNDRFEAVYSQEGFLSASITIDVDKMTGVQYVWHKEFHAGGMTVLLDAQGKPLLYQPPENQ